MVAEQVEKRIFLQLSEVRERFDEVFARVEGGESVAILRDGRVVAELLPGPEQKSDPDVRREAFERFLQERAKWPRTYVTRGDTGLAPRRPSRVSRLIVDASATLTFLLDDEWDARAESAFEWVDREGGCVPQHWHYEVRNGLLVNVRRERLAQEDALRRLSSLDRFRWETDGASDLDLALRLAFEHGLTFYDALYLELAIRRALPLATLDNDLARAAQRAGAEVLVD